MLLVAHSKPLLLVDDDQTQVLEVDVGLEEPVGADDDVHITTGQGFYHFPLFSLRYETGEHGHAHGEGRQAAAKSLPVLLGQDGGGHQDGHLLSVHHRLEGCPQGDLRLAIAHVTADEAVHGAWALHIPLHLSDGCQLVGRL
jgi:hypothetical protein